LRSLGFIKKGHSFYRKTRVLLQVINIQKSAYYSKQHVQFTINTGVFASKVWYALYGQSGRRLPEFPSVSECIIRRRIGALRTQKDTWYIVTRECNEQNLIDEMKKNLDAYILPHFRRIQTKQNIVQFLSKNSVEAEPLEKLIVFAEWGHVQEAKGEYNRLVRDSSDNAEFLEMVQGYGRKYRLKSHKKKTQ